MTDDRHNDDHSDHNDDHVPTAADGKARDEGGDEATRADREVVRAIRDAYLSADLLRPGPGLWPFGRRARERRARDRAAAAEAQRRRHQIHTSINRQPSAIGPRTGRESSRDRDTATAPRVAGWRPVERRTHILVITCLVGLVGVVVAVAVWWAGPDPQSGNRSATTSPAPESTDTQSTAMTSSGAAAATGTAGGSLPARPPIPPGGVAPMTPGPHAPVDPGSVRLVEPPVGDPTPRELATPQAAMHAWLARWCPFHYRDAYGVAEQRARGAMTDNGWATFNPLDGDDSDQQARASWDTTVAAHEAGRCAEPAARVSPEAPRSATAVVVIGAITRVVTTADQTGGTAAGFEPYVEDVSTVRVVRRGADGLWRIDLPAQGG